MGYNKLTYKLGKEIAKNIDPEDRFINLLPSNTALAIINLTSAWELTCNVSRFFPGLYLKLKEMLKLLSSDLFGDKNNIDNFYELLAAIRN